MVGPGGTAQSSVTVTAHRANSSQDAASVGKDCGVPVVNDTASVSMASATRQMARVLVHRGTVASSAGNHVLLGFMVKTAGTGGLKKTKTCTIFITIESVQSYSVDPQCLFPLV